MLHVVVTRFMIGQGELPKLADARLRLFETVCAATMAAQDGSARGRFVWLVYAAAELPAEDVEQLAELVRGVSPHAHLILAHMGHQAYLKPMRQQLATVGKAYEQALGESDWLLATRLDADDGLHRAALASMHDAAGRTPGNAVYRWMCWFGAVQWSPRIRGTGDSAAGSLDADSERTNECVSAGLSALTTLHPPEGVTLPRFHSVPHNKLFKDHSDGDCGVKPCVKVLRTPEPAVVRSRTVTSNSMDKTQLDTFHGPARWDTGNAKLKDFGMSRDKLEQLNAHLGDPGELASIAREALSGRCQKGWSCRYGGAVKLKEVVYSFAEDAEDPASMLPDGVAPVVQRREDIDVTLVTQCTALLVPYLMELATRWGGQTVAAVWARDEGERNSTLALGHMPRKNLRVSLVEPASEHEAGQVYPVNRMRNAALAMAKTSHVLVVDVDMFPSDNLRTILRKALRYSFVGLDPRSAVVVPAFDRADRDSRRRGCSGTGKTYSGCLRRYKGDVHRTFDALQQCRKQGECMSVGHTPEGELENLWALSGPPALRRCWPSEEPWDSSAPDSVAPAGVWGMDRKLWSYAPYVVVPREAAPPFDQRFKGWGGDRVAWTASLLYRRFQLLVLRRGFLMHCAHPESDSRKRYDRSLNLRTKSTELLVKLLKELRREFGEIPNDEIPSTKMSCKLS